MFFAWISALSAAISRLIRSEEPFDWDDDEDPLSSPWP
jgi:hypothetical protein